MPPEVYGLSPFKNLDGIDLHYRKRWMSSIFSLKLFYGDSEAAFSFADGFSVIDLPKFKGGSLGYSADSWDMQLRYSYGKPQIQDESVSLMTNAIGLIDDRILPNKPRLVYKLFATDDGVDFTSLSTSKQWRNWDFSSEITRIKVLKGSQNPLYTGYFSAAYHLDEHVFYSIYAKTYNKGYQFDETLNQNPTSADPIEQQILNFQLQQVNTLIVPTVEAILNYYQANQQTVSFGWRKNISSRVSSKVQLNVTNIEEDSAKLWLNPNPLNVEKS